MAEAIPYAAIALFAIGAWVGGVVLLDVFSATDARAWRRMAHLRGFATRQSASRESGAWSADSQAYSI